MEVSETAQDNPPAEILAHWQYTQSEWQYFADYVRQQSQATARVIIIALSGFFAVIYGGILLGANSLPFKLVVVLLIFVLFHLPVLGLWWAARRNKNVPIWTDRPNEVIITPTSLQWNAKREEFYFLVDAVVKLAPASSAPQLPDLFLVRVNRRQSYRRYEIPIPAGQQQAAQELAAWINSPPQAE